jgi:alpha-glucosidase
MTACSGIRSRFLQCIAFQLAYVGAPCIYYGAETGLEGGYAEDGRRCMPWDKLDSDLHGFFKHIIQTRNASKALRLGDIETVLIDDEQRVYGFVRRYQDEAVYAIFNSSDQPAKIELSVSATADTSGVEGTTFHDLLQLQPDLQVKAGKLSFELPGSGMVWYQA